MHKYRKYSLEEKMISINKSLNQGVSRWEDIFRM